MVSRDAAGLITAHARNMGPSWAGHCDFLGAENLTEANLAKLTSAAEVVLPETGGNDRAEPVRHTGPSASHSVSLFGEAVAARGPEGKLDLTRCHCCRRRLRWEVRLWCDWCRRLCCVDCWVDEWDCCYEWD